MVDIVLAVLVAEVEIATVDDHCSCLHTGHDRHSLWSTRVTRVMMTMVKKVYGW